MICPACLPCCTGSSVLARTSGVWSEALDAVGPGRAVCSRRRISWFRAPPLFNHSGSLEESGEFKGGMHGVRGPVRDVQGPGTRLLPRPPGLGSPTRGVRFGADKTGTNWRGVARPWRGLGRAPRRGRGRRRGRGLRPLRLLLSASSPPPRLRPAPLGPGPGAPAPRCAAAEAEAEGPRWPRRRGSTTWSGRRRWNSCTRSCASSWIPHLAPRGPRPAGTRTSGGRWRRASSSRSCSRPAAGRTTPSS